MSSIDRTAVGAFGPAEALGSPSPSGVEEVPMAFIATVPQGGQPSNRTLLDRVKSVLGTLYNVKKCIHVKFEKLPSNFPFTKITR